MNSSRLIEAARDTMRKQTKINNAPAWPLTEIAVQKGRELADRHHARDDLVVIALYLAHSRFSDEIGGDVQKNHFRLSADFAATFLAEHHMAPDDIAVVVNAIRAHHDHEPTTSLEAEIVKNAEGFKFLTVTGALVFLHDLGRRGLPLEQAAQEVLRKLDQKMSYLTMPECIDEATRNANDIRALMSALQRSGAVSTKTVEPGAQSPDATFMEHRERDPISTAVDAVKGATDIAQDWLEKGYSVDWKPDTSPVTPLDRDVNTYVTSVIAEHFPEDSILSEEDRRRPGTSGYTWVVDPIDGTQSLGLVPTAMIVLARLDKNGKPMFGIAGNIATGDIWKADSTGVAAMNDKPLRVSQQSSLQSAYIFIGSRMPEFTATNGQIYDCLETENAKVFNVRSLAYGSLMVAAGKAAGAIIGVSTPYEAALASLIITNAGGKVTDLSGKTVTRYDRDIPGLIASNGLVHDRLVEIIHSANPPEGAVA